MPLFHIGSTSQNTCFMVYLSEQCLKTDTPAVTIRNRSKRWRAGATCWHRSGMFTLFCMKKLGIRWILWLNQSIPPAKSRNTYKSGTRAVTVRNRGKRNGYMDSHCVLDVTGSKNTFSFKPPVKGRFSAVIKLFGCQNLRKQKSRVPPSHPQIASNIIFDPDLQ